MAFNKFKFNHGNEILFLALMVLLLAPRDYKLAGLGILCFFLITAALFDWRKNSKRVRRITKRVAHCSCVKARDTLSHMPNLLQANNSCTLCSAEANSAA